MTTNKSRRWVIGDLLDVESGDIYSPARIIDVNYDEVSKKLKDYRSKYLAQCPKPHIVVHYIGWEESYDEAIAIDSLGDRVTISGMHVKKYKVWVNLSSEFPVWPCYLYVRSVKDNNKGAIKFLKQEKYMLVIPYGLNQNCMKPYRTGTKSSPIKR